MKTSLHGSNRWRFGFTSQGAAAKRDPVMDRAVVKWTRPPDRLPGLTQAVVLVFPTDELRAYSSREPRAGKVKWILPAPPGCASIVTVFIDEDPTMGEWPGKRASRSELIAELPLLRGGAVQLTLHYLRVPRQHNKSREMHKFRATLGAMRHLRRLESGVYLRGWVMQTDDDGTRVFTDVALERPGPREFARLLPKLWFGILTGRVPRRPPPSDFLAS